MIRFDRYNFANFIPEIIFVYIFPNTNLIDKLFHNCGIKFLNIQATTATNT